VILLTLHDLNQI